MSSAHQRLLSTAEAAEFLGVSCGFLNKRRMTPGGPPFVKIGGRVLYDPADLTAWVQAQKRCFTSDASQPLGLFPVQTVRARIVELRSEAFAVSYLDPATWNPDARTITAWTDTARLKLCELELKAAFAELGVTISDLVGGGL